MDTLAAQDHLSAVAIDNESATAQLTSHLNPDCASNCVCEIRDVVDYTVKCFVFFLLVVAFAGALLRHPCTVYQRIIGVSLDCYNPVE